MARKCVFCRGTPVTLEHVFRRSYIKRLGNSGFDRQFVQLKQGKSLMTTRNENPNDCQVKRVCAKCNNGWMNRLDNTVDSWVFDPSSPPACTNAEFRRWAIKTAILRAMVDRPGIIPSEDCVTLHQGKDLPAWRIFVGHTDFEEFRHAYAATGGGKQKAGPMTAGIIQVSWVIGYSLVVALRAMGEFGDGLAVHFDNYNFNAGWPLAEITTTTDDFPSFELRPRVEWPLQIRSIASFFTPEPASPIADFMQELSKAIKAETVGWL